MKVHRIFHAGKFSYTPVQIKHCRDNAELIIPYTFIKNMIPLVTVFTR